LIDGNERAVSGDALPRAERFGFSMKPVASGLALHFCLCCSLRATLFAFFEGVTPPYNVFGFKDTKVGNGLRLLPCRIERPKSIFFFRRRASGWNANSSSESGRAFTPCSMHLGPVQISMVVVQNVRNKQTTNNEPEKSLTLFRIFTQNIFIKFQYHLYVSKKPSSLSLFFRNRREMFFGNKKI
jgi:hypothetical protein